MLPRAATASLRIDVYLQGVDSGRLRVSPPRQARRELSGLGSAGRRLVTGLGPFLRPSLACLSLCSERRLVRDGNRGAWPILPREGDCPSVSSLLSFHFIQVREAGTASSDSASNLSRRLLGRNRRQTRSLCLEGRHKSGGGGGPALLGVGAEFAEASGGSRRMSEYGLSIACQRSI